MRRRMPISLWRKWMGWANTQGPLGGLGDDFRTMQVALELAKPYIPKESHRLELFIQPWRRPSDFKQWADLGEDPKPQEFVID